MSRLNRRTFLASLVAAPLVAKVVIATPAQIVKPVAPARDDGPKKWVFDGAGGFTKMTYLTCVTAIALGKLPAELDIETVYAWTAYEASK